MPHPVVDADRLIETTAFLKGVFAESREQARLLGHSYVGTEHLLLALARTTPHLFSDSAAIRLKILRILGHASY